MSRIYIDTDALKSLAGSFRQDAEALAGIRLDLTRGWARTHAPPLQLLSLEHHWRSIQSDLSLIGTQITLQGRDLDANADALSSEQGRGSVIRDVSGVGLVGFFSGSGASGLVAKEWIYGEVPDPLEITNWIVGGVVDVEQEATEHPLQAIRDVFLQTKNLSPDASYVVSLARIVPGVQPVMDGAVCLFYQAKSQLFDVPKEIVDTARYGPGSRPVANDIKQQRSDGAEAAKRGVDTAAGVYITGPKGTVLAGGSVAAATADRMNSTRYSDYLTPSYDLQWLYDHLKPQPVH